VRFNGARKNGILMITRADACIFRLAPAIIMPISSMTEYLVDLPRVQKKRFTKG